MTQTTSYSYRWVILAIAFLTGLTLIGGISSYQVILPELANKLKLTSEQTIWTITLFSWGLWIGFGLAAPIISRIGSKNTLLTGLLLLAVPQFIIAFTSSFQLILLLRFLQGLTSMGIPVLFGFVAGSGWFPPRESGLASGVFLAGLSAGAFFGGAIAGSLVSYGLQIPILVIGGFVAVMFFVSLFGLKLPPAAPQTQTQTAKVTPQAGNVGALSKPLLTKTNPYRMKETWLMAVLLFGVCWMYWGFPMVWPFFAGEIGCSAMQVGTLATVIGLMGFLCIVGGVGSDVLLRRTGNVSFSRLSLVLLGVIITAVGIALTVRVSTFPALIMVAFLAGFWNLGIAPYWTLLGVVFPSDPELVGKAASIITFLGNSPAIFILPLSIWIARSTSWSGTFIVIGVMFTSISLISLFFMARNIRMKQVSKG